jgi:glycerol-3-phosphate dehydrogenase (NAD(P)+)
VAEGVPTTAAACLLAEKVSVEIPIHLELQRILFEGAPVREAVERLMTRPYRDEHAGD